MYYVISVEDGSAQVSKIFAFANSSCFRPLYHTHTGMFFQVGRSMGVEC